MHVTGDVCSHLFFFLSFFPSCVNNKPVHKCSFFLSHVLALRQKEKHTHTHTHTHTHKNRNSDTPKKKKKKSLKNSTFSYFFPLSWYITFIIQTRERLTRDYIDPLPLTIWSLKEDMKCNIGFRMQFTG